MRNLRNILALVVLTVALYSCDSTVTVDDPNTETIQEIDTKTGNEESEDDERGGS